MKWHVLSEATQLELGHTEYKFVEEDFCWKMICGEVGPLELHGTFGGKTARILSGHNDFSSERLATFLYPTLFGLQILADQLVRLGLVYTQRPAAEVGECEALFINYFAHCLEVRDVLEGKRNRVTTRFITSAEGILPIHADVKIILADGTYDGVGIKIGGKTPFDYSLLVNIQGEVGNQLRHLAVTNRNLFEFFTITACWSVAATVEALMATIETGDWQCPEVLSVSGQAAQIMSFSTWLCDHVVPRTEQLLC